MDLTLLAQANEVIKLSGDAINKSSEFGFAALFLMVVFLTAAAYSGAKFWFIERPESKTRRETAEKNAESMQKISVAVSAICEQLDQHTADHQNQERDHSAIKASLQQIHKDVLKARQSNHPSNRPQSPNDSKGT